MDAKRSSKSKVVALDDLVIKVRRARHAGQSVVFTNGCFDLLHIGHVTHLQQAAEMGDLFVVAVNSDASVNRLKGTCRPERDPAAAMVAALECVDLVINFNDLTPVRLLERIRPDVLVKGGAYAACEIVGRELVEAYGGAVRTTAHCDGVSTTSLVQSIRGASPAPAVPADTRTAASESSKLFV